MEMLVLVVGERAAKRQRTTDLRSGIARRDERDEAPALVCGRCGFDRMIVAPLAPRLRRPDQPRPGLGEGAKVLAGASLDLGKDRLENVVPRELIERRIAVSPRFVAAHDPVSACALEVRVPPVPQARPVDAIMSGSSVQAGRGAHAQA